MLNKLRPELLILCKNNADLLKRRVIPYHSLQDKDLSGIDYEFFLSDRKEEDKYNLCAFCKEHNYNRELTMLKKWEEFIKSQCLI